MPVERLRATARGVVAAALLAAAGAAWAQAVPPAPARAAACMACHGAEGRSRDPQVPSLAGQPRTFVENQLVLIREGLRPVPAMQGLLDGVPDAELVALAQYFAALPPPPAAAATDGAAYQRGQALASRMLCGTCHLPGYGGQQQVPRIAAQPEPFLLASMKQLRDRPGPGRDTIMAAALHGLKDADLADLAHFLAHFQPPSPAR